MHITNDEITGWAYIMFGPDCQPVIEDRLGEPYLCIIDPTRKKRYALHITKGLIREDKLGKVMFDGTVH
jgi:hypothetical protein